MLDSARGAMRALLEDREQMQKVLDDPALVKSTVEEALRMFPAFAHFARTATRDTELGGQPIKKGDRLYRIDPVPFQLEVNTRQAQIDEIWVGILSRSRSNSSSTSWGVPGDTRMNSARYT